MIETLIVYAVGVIVGSIINNLIRYVCSGRGTLTIDHTDSTTDAYHFDVDSLDDLDKKKYFILKVKHVSQK